MGFRVSFRIAATGIVVLCSAALTPIGDSAAPPDFGQPLAGLPADLIDRFNEGKDGVRGSRDGGGGRRAGHERRVLRELPHSPERSAAAARRSRRASAGSGATVCSIPWRTPAARSSRSRASAPPGTCEYLSEIVPPEATITAERRTTPLFGLGLVDAVPDSTFYAIAYEEKFHPDGIAGLVSVVTKIATGTAGGRQVRLEVPEPEPLSILRRRVPQRDGHHQPRVSRRELPAGRLRPPELQPDAGRQRRRHRRAGVHRLHDLPRAAAARPDHGAGGLRRARLPGNRLQRVPPFGDPDGLEPRRRPQQGDLPSVLRLPAPRHGQPRRRHHAEPRDRASSCARRRSGGCARSRPTCTTGAPRRSTRRSSRTRARPRRRATATRPCPTTRRRGSWRFSTRCNTDAAPSPPAPGERAGGGA